MKRKPIYSVHGFIEAGGVARNGAATHGATIGLHHYGEDTHRTETIATGVPTPKIEREPK